jgi:glycosyltransferase involved in cell wall biosynthesis
MERVQGTLLARLRRIAPDYAGYQVRRLLARRLAHSLRRRSQAAGEDCIFYAQDTTSACVAIHCRNRMGARHTPVALMAHFNTSEAHELVINGLGREGGKLHRALVAAEEHACGGLDLLVAPSHWLLSRILARHPQLDARLRCEVIPYSIPETIDTQKRSQPELPATDVLSIGSCDRRKNHQYLLRVLHCAKNRGLCYRMVIAGDGPERTHLVQMAGQLGIGDQLTMAGHVPGARRMMAAARVYAHSAIEDNLPISLLEALEAGRPICAARVGGIPEIYRDGIEGFFWDLDNPEGGAERLIEILENSSTYGAMSQAAQKRYHACFTTASGYQRLLECLSDLLESA